MKKEKKNLQLAQTTHLALFGPVILVFTTFVRVFRSITVNILLVSKKRTQKNKKKRLTNGPNDVEHIVWACSPRLSGYFLL